MITSLPPATVVAGDTYRYDVRADDPDGDRLIFEFVAGPDGATLDALGRVEFPTGLANAGTHRFELIVSDGRGGADLQSFEIEVLPDTVAPVVQLFVSANPAIIGFEVIFLVQATDNIAVESRSLTIDGTPVALDASGRTTFLLEIAGFFDVVAAATDTSGNVGTDTLELVVIDPSDVNAPVVEITSPADESVVTTFTDIIGTVDDPDDNLVDYTLSVAPFGTDDFVVIGSGTTEVLDDVLGVFDPTMLANDIYVLRLTALDAGGNTSFAEILVSVEGEQKIGDFQVTFIDLALPIDGITITLARTYDTLEANRRDELGFGWRLDFRDADVRTSVLPNEVFDEPFYDGARVYVTIPGLGRQGFTFRPQVAPGLRGSFLGLFDPVFVPDPGVTSTLTVDRFELVLNSRGEAFSFGGGLPYNPTSSAFGGRFVLTTISGLAYELDGVAGDIRRVSDTNDHTVTFTDDGITSSRGVSVNFERDPQGRITAAIDPMGNRIEYGYDANGDFVSVTDREGNVTRYLYRADRPHFLDKVIDPLGREGLRTEYDAEGRLKRTTDAEGHALEFAYDPANSTQEVMDALGNTTTFEYDERGNILTVIDADGEISRATYDGEGNQLTATDPLGNMVSFSYDEFRQPTSLTDPLSNTTFFTYQRFTFGVSVVARTQGRASLPFSMLTSEIDPLGDVTEQSYDSRGNLVEYRDPLGNHAGAEVDGAGDAVSITDLSGAAVFREYDSRGLPQLQTDPLGNVVEFTFDANGNRLSERTTVTTSSGAQVLERLWTYDAENRVVSETDPEGNTTFFEYDAFSNRTAINDALSRRTEFEYDLRNQHVRTVHPDGGTEEFEYNALGRQTAAIDRAGRRTVFVYDKLGRLIETVFPDDTPGDATDNPSRRSEYDAAGRVTAVIDELGNRGEFEYDAMGRRTVIRDALGNELTSIYDAVGRRVSVTDELGRTTNFIYSSRGELIETQFADGTAFSSAFDAMTHPVSVTDELGRVTTFAYDDAGRMTAVVDARGGRTESEYDEVGRLVRQIDASDHETRFEYDGLGHRTAVLQPLGQRSEMTYDAVGNLISLKDFNGLTLIFEYDDLNRRTAERFADGSSAVYTYTATGQRASVTDSRGVTLYTYDTNDRLTSQTKPDGRSITYT